MLPEAQKTKLEPTYDPEVDYIAARSDRRPDFTAEALSPAFRIGLLLVVLSADFALMVALVAMAVRPMGVFDFGELFGVLYVGGLTGLTFFIFLVFGAFLGNNPRLSTGERTAWYLLFAFAGPLALPAYWLTEIWPAPFQPMLHQTT